MIKGLELSKQYYERYGKPMIAQQFPEYENRIAVGLVGSGSECFGYDDEISEDHDFEAGFCMWLTREDDKAIGFPLFRAYKKLPPEFMGIKKQDQSFFGGNRRGVLEIGEFYSQFTGSFGAPTKWSQWMTLPESALAEAVNGQVFRDDLGEFTRIRTELQKGFPEDVRLKKLAARTALAAQAGQYNFSRCIRRREMGAAGLAIAEFVKMAVSAVYLLNRRYTPYYKWMIRGLRELEHLSHLADPLQDLLLNWGANPEECQKSIESICWDIILEIKRQGLSKGSWDYLEPHAREIMEQIQDAQIRNLHLMDG
ncbi:MAG: DUF4037 domain-containing protein [Lachnospiraceae bacterium]